MKPQLKSIAVYGESRPGLQLQRAKTQHTRSQYDHAIHANHRFNATGALVELLDFGLVGSSNIPVLCSFDTDVADSTFAITFDYFGNLSLYYDPGKDGVNLCKRFLSLTISIYQRTFTNTGTERTIFKQSKQ